MAGIAFGAETATPDIVFIHATGFNARTYRTLLAPLGERFHVLALDMRGHGLTNLPHKLFSYTSWKRHRDDLIAVLEHFTAPVTLAGHSMGATISL
ncbi:MAG TPA: alpha/beta fold hydrolase, partial [Chloroflexota bacterium]|nr:alpha/beta fold hydrolase [Chloroflexota bacterium]